MTIVDYNLTPPPSAALACSESAAADARRALYAATKVTMDLVLAAVLFVVLGPLILLLLVIVRLTSPGPALYSQIRLGRGGRPFRIYKVRTMTYDCERLTGPQWSKTGDSRVTRVGRVLRRCHLDELPQLWNVLRGEMSLIGPRPERPEIVTQLERAIPGYSERLRVRPGVSGLAQVLLPPDEDLAGVRRKLAYDFCYIEQASWWLDVRVLVATLFKVLSVPTELRRSILGLPTRPAYQVAPLQDAPADEESLSLVQSF